MLNNYFGRTYMIGVVTEYKRGYKEQGLFKTQMKTYLFIMLCINKLFNSIQFNSMFLWNYIFAKVEEGCSIKLTLKY